MASPFPAFQFSYTAVFGAYTAFLFIRTGWSLPHGSQGSSWEAVFIPESFSYHSARDRRAQALRQAWRWVGWPAARGASQMVELLRHLSPFLGHLIGPVLCHSFCNYMGFPAVCAALEHPQRRPLLAGYALGVGLFLLLLQPLTDPKLYGSLPLCVLLERAGDSEAPLCS